jgi:endogenous inhibitor of DNA gyrase (YacG/DUF329 family)
MKHVDCTCGQRVSLTGLPKRPFVECPLCGRRLPVHVEPAEFLDQCPKCGRYLDRSVISIHTAVCSGVEAPAAHQ